MRKRSIVAARLAALKQNGGIPYVIRKPSAAWNQETIPVTATVARQLTDVAIGGALAGRRLLYFARGALFGLFALLWGWAGLAAGLIGGDPITLIGAGGGGILMASLARRSFSKALGRR